MADMNETTESEPADAPGPFDFSTETGAHRPALSQEVVAALAAGIKTIPEDQAAAVLRAAAEAIRERQAATDVLQMVFSSVGRIIGIVT